MAVKIIGTGSYLPKKVADNIFLSSPLLTLTLGLKQNSGFCLFGCFVFHMHQWHMEVPRLEV